MYISRIASNEVFKFNKPTIVIIIILITTIIILNKDQTIEYSTKIIENKIFILNNEELKTTSKFLRKFKSNNTIIIILTLLLTIISVTNISRTFEGPLKKTYV